MADGGLLGGIMNPAQTDVLGAMDKGRDRQATRMAGEMLGETMGGKIGALAKLSPDKAMAYAKALNIPLDATGRINKAIGTQVMVTKLLDAGQQDLAAQLLEDQIMQMETANNEPADKFRMALDSIKGYGDPEVMKNFMAGGRALDPSKKIGAKDQSIIDLNNARAADLAGGKGGTPKQKERSALLADLSSPDSTVSKSAAIALGLEPRAIGSAIQTIAEKGTANTIANTEGIISQGQEGGKQKAKLLFGPKIATAVTLATKAATARGETLTDLVRSEAALPGLLDSVSQLKDLSLVATSTLGGKAFDTIVKESGFGATEGSDARAKFVAIINNQVLPLLRQTFGAAFTEKEGETLKATMGDPDATPSQKILQLESFIDQKVRNIQASQRELEKEITPSQELSGAQPQIMRFDAQGNQI